MEKMSQSWIAVVGSSALCYALKYLGTVIPHQWLEKPRFTRVNNLIPIALLTALVAVNVFAVKTKLVIDQRIFGIAAAIILLSLKRSFLTVIVGAALVSALAYKYIY
jgi:branched-subunit amino acid transport protein